MDPGINAGPGSRRAIDSENVSATRDLIYYAERFREKVAALDRRLGRDLGESIADPARGAVMALTESGGKNEDFFHGGRRRGSLMDNCGGQSTLATP